MPRWTRELRLLGAGSLSEHLDFVRDETRAGRDADEGIVADEWRAAASRFEELANTEAGIADAADLRPLPTEADAWLAELVAQPHFQRTFGIVPIAFGLVEVDRLMLMQHHICLDHVDRRLVRSDEHPLMDLVRRCLPHAPNSPRITICRSGGQEYIAHSRSMDLRFLGAEMLRPQEVRGPAFAGSVAAVIALAVGFSANCVSVVRFGKRMMLHNGYHRTYYLRAQGITHVPAVVMGCSSHEDVELAGGDKVAHAFSRYGDSARPPMFKDFFDPELVCSYRTEPVRKQIRIAFQVDTSTVHD